MVGPQDYLTRQGLSVDPVLVHFLETEALPASEVGATQFWAGLTLLVDTMSARNQELLDRRTALQQQIDDWHRERVGQPHDAAGYRQFLSKIGYLVPQGPNFTITTTGVDAEIASLAGPQLVVPVSNARYALNAANARWGSLYDALYGTDALGSPPPRGGYDAERGAQVVSWARKFLDDTIPLDNGSYAAATGFTVGAGTLLINQPDGSTASLQDPAAFVGFTGPLQAPTSIVLRQHGLLVEIVIDAGAPVGSTDAAGVSDVLLEAALTTIVDFEDSVAVVDAADKVASYRNWLGLMTGELTEQVTKGAHTFTRRLNADRPITAPDGSSIEIRSRALLLARNVGHLMTSPAVRDRDGADVFEGLLDSMVTVTIALANSHSTQANSRHGSIYIVKPKMHGPDEVAFTSEVFTLIEQALGLPPNTVKIGIMDEERRTTLNLAECIRVAKSRVAFINTGFLDRTGDEIHTSMQAGPMVAKTEMKQQPWIKAYEDWNVDVGLACGLAGRAQIGKGMWAAPDRMAAMLTDKIVQPQSGASCAWVPSPTAATLHATHYHRVDVSARQTALAAGPRRATLTELLKIPLAGESPTPAAISDELHNNAQGILGYVVRWIDQGIGCSKVPDINGVGLMEDRATCRISSQHIANWLLHGVLSLEQVDQALRQMALVVDSQNAEDPAYQPMGPALDGVAFHAARDLIVKGLDQPAGYTEPILHTARLVAKGLLSFD